MGRNCLTCYTLAGTTGCTFVSAPVQPNSLQQSISQATYILWQSCSSMSFSNRLLEDQECFARAFSIQKQNMPSQRRWETVTLSLLTPVHGPPSARAVVLFLEVSATMLRLSVGKDGYVQTITCLHVNLVQTACFYHRICQFCPAGKPYVNRWRIKPEIIKSILNL